MKRTFGALTLTDAMRLIPAEQLTPWNPEAPAQMPSETIVDFMRRLKAFDLRSSEAAKVLLIDTLLAEVVPSYPGLKVWKSTPLESEELAGIADYVISPNLAFVRSPLLCAVEAKRDDFVQGLAQCIGEMVACRSNNRMADLEIDVYGVVSNGQIWQFYRLATDNTIYETAEYGFNDLPHLIGQLHSVCAACAANIPDRTPPAQN